MARVSHKLIDPADSQSHISQTRAITHELDGRVSFGDPQDPKDPASRVRADGLLGNDPIAGGNFPDKMHNGILENMHGSWVELFYSASAGSQRERLFITHNLNQPLVAADVLNIRWLQVGVFHDLNGGTFGTTRILTDVAWFPGGTMDEDRCEVIVTAFVGGGLTINALHPLIITLFVIPATRHSVPGIP